MRIFLSFILVFVFKHLHASQALDTPALDDITPFETLSFEEIAAARFIPTVFVVGSTRAARWTDPALETILSIKDADFTHTRSFSGHVTTVDTSPSSIPSLSYIQTDWITHTFKMTPNTIFFEWFPSFSPDTLEPILLRSLRKAFDILAPGGELILDHLPYALILPGKYIDALSTLSKKTSIDSIKSMLPKEEELRKDGIVSQLWQQEDPFSISMSKREKLDLIQLIRIKILELDGTEASTKILDAQTCQEALENAITLLENIFNEEYPVILNKLYSALLFDLGFKEDRGGIQRPDYVSMFEWIYFMHSRRILMKMALEKLGFVVLDNFITYHEINPYNKRKHAWIIKACKPF